LWAQSSSRRGCVTGEGIQTLSVIILVRFEGNFRIQGTRVCVCTSTLPTPTLCAIANHSQPKKISFPGPENGFFPFLSWVANTQVKVRQAQGLQPRSHHTPHKSDWPGARVGGALYRRAAARPLDWTSDLRWTHDGNLCCLLQCLFRLSIFSAFSSRFFGIRRLRRPFRHQTRFRLSNFKGCPTWNWTSQAFVFK